MSKIPVIFMGTPDFAVPALKALHDIARIKLVVSQPDKPSGRGLELTPTPVAACAKALGLPLFQPTKIKTPEFAETLKQTGAQLAVVVAYGRILPKHILDLFPFGCVNVHASLLPHWRGAAPIQWAIHAGDKETGVCLMRMDEGLDTGDVISVSKIPILPEDTGGSLFLKLSELGANTLAAKLHGYISGELKPYAQSGTPTHASIITKEMGSIDWTRSAKAIRDQIHAFDPWPGTFTTFLHQNKPLRIKLFPQARVLSPSDVKNVKMPDVNVPGTKADVHGSVIPGTLANLNPLTFQCGTGQLQISEVQVEGKKRMQAAEFVSGYRMAVGARFVNP